jgi:hypothetical protein
MSTVASSPIEEAEGSRRFQRRLCRWRDRHSDCRSNAVDLLALAQFSRAKPRPTRHPDFGGGEFTNWCGFAATLPITSARTSFGRSKRARSAGRAAQACSSGQGPAPTLRRGKLRQCGPSAKRGGAAATEHGMHFPRSIPIAAAAGILPLFHTSPAHVLLRQCRHSCPSISRQAPCIRARRPHAVAHRSLWRTLVSVYLGESGALAWAHRWEGTNGEGAPIAVPSPRRRRLKSI